MQTWVGHWATRCMKILCVWKVRCQKARKGTERRDPKIPLKINLTYFPTLPSEGIWVGNMYSLFLNEDLSLSNSFCWLQLSFQAIEIILSHDSVLQHSSHSPPGAGQPQIYCVPSMFLAKSLVLNLGFRVSISVLRLYMTLFVYKNFPVERSREFSAFSQGDPWPQKRLKTTDPAIQYFEQNNAHQDRVL